MAIFDSYNVFLLHRFLIFSYVIKRAFSKSCKKLIAVTWLLGLIRMQEVAKLLAFTGSKEKGPPEFCAPCITVEREASSRQHPDDTSN